MAKLRSPLSLAITSMILASSLSSLTPAQLEKIKGEYLPSILGHLKHIELKRTLDYSGVALSNIVIDTPGLNMDEISVTETGNHLEITGKDIETSIKFDMLVTKAFLNNKGVGKVNGAVKRINFFLDMSQIFDLNNPSPKAFVTFNTFLLDEDNLDIDLDINGIPNFITSFIVTLMKGRIVTQIGDLALKFIQSYGQTMVNQIMTEKLATLRKTLTQTATSSSVLGD